MPLVAAVRTRVRDALALEYQLWALAAGTVSRYKTGLWFAIHHTVYQLCLSAQENYVNKESSRFRFGGCAHRRNYRYTARAGALSGGNNGGLMAKHSEGEFTREPSWLRILREA